MSYSIAAAVSSSQHAWLSYWATFFSLFVIILSTMFMRLWFCVFYVPNMYC